MSELETLPYALVPFMALIIDAVIGDPRSDWHPVVLIGKLISTWENKLYPKHHTDNIKLFLYGCGVVLLVLVSVGIVSTVILYIAAKAGIFCYFLLSAVLLYVSITPRALARDGMEIYNLLKKGNVETARARLSWIVGRDTDGLNESEISRGTIETVAENTTDGIISPLFYFLLLGPIGAIVYRAGNTMDSMIGYKNERYLFFGRAAARLDDVLNYIPARVTYFVMRTNIRVPMGVMLKLLWRVQCMCSLADIIITMGNRSFVLIWGIRIKLCGRSTLRLLFG